MRYGLVRIRELIELCAYYKFLNGSTDSVLNWLEAEREVLANMGVTWD